MSANQVLKGLPPGRWDEPSFASGHGVPPSGGETVRRGQSRDSSAEKLSSVTPAEAGTPCQNASLVVHPADFSLRFSSLVRGRIAVRFWSVALLLAGVLLVAGCKPEGAGRAPTIATTTSYLECAARDLLGEGLTVLRLAEPGTCPGHFDLRPSQATQLRQCRMLLRFDFQKSIEAKAGLGDTNQFRVAVVSLQYGMCHPESYLSACWQLAEFFIATGSLTRASADERLQAITRRIEALARETSRRAAQAGLPGRTVIASGHQRDVCEWLGLKVAATFRAADTASLSEIEAAIGAGKLAGVQLVIANAPEGHRMADALAERFQARVVVFNNFPALQDGRMSFDALLAGNVDALLRASTP